MTTNGVPDGRTPRARPPRVLSIAGTDPTGGAGIQADLKSIAASGGYGMAVVTALVAQNTHGVRSIHTPPVAFLREQLDAVSDDVTIDAVKIGMLGSTAVIDEVADWLRRNRAPIVVLDPVMIATSGDRLLDADAEEAVRRLLPLVDLVTPNLPELAVLADEPLSTTWAEALDQAARVSEEGSVTVLVKGGHLSGAQSPDALVDAAGRLPEGSTVIEVPGERIPTSNTHGTGCSLSSAMATLRARHGDWHTALIDAKAWLGGSLRFADDLDVGSGSGPINHFWSLWRGDGASAIPRTLTDAWWADIDDIRTKIDRLAFVRGLADGSLAEEEFAHYLAQDALYLRDYARALARASQLAPTTEEQAFWADAAHASIASEMEVHRDWLGTRRTARPEPHPVTTAYLTHLLAVSGGSDYGVLIAALLPCFWIYRDVGMRLRAHASGEHPYASWLETYADPMFAAATSQAIDYVGRSAVRAGADDRDAMWRAFRASAQFELEFFAMSSREGCSPSS
ncbi:bifunctional hydroxymethylpyrimidine kinase/phosphomethylpyrimidine kinase [Planctomonas psychrotolerans]|uniref:bifunctional hydroxymethylpyrimidine kinase/phosphomethylpyrimidine kinase n=1 Tax=Planctomonas psychrotolerans TaxID=2528712 RepID=UPI001D0D3F97|nr:bifunctional hydroxymethylpyrimidine kinase/phosphomethylpyrimidine kinase [Planctomonas psychrotolerans]